MSPVSNDRFSHSHHLSSLPYGPGSSICYHAECEGGPPLLGPDLRHPNGSPLTIMLAISFFFGGNLYQTMKCPFSS